MTGTNLPEAVAGIEIGIISSQLSVLCLEKLQGNVKIYTHFIAIILDFVVS